jgi:DNA-binding transcriptional ArsR family regulator
MLAVLIPPATTAAGPTEVGGDVSGLWTLDGSPYVAVENLTVAEGTTLKIDPGVEVLFNERFGLTVNGTLLVRGTASNHVLFAANTTGPAPHGYWDGILLQGESAGLENLTVESAETAIKAIGQSIQAHGVGITNVAKGLRIEHGSFSVTGLAVTEAQMAAVDTFNADFATTNAHLTANVRAFVATNTTLRFTDSRVSGSIVAEFQLEDSTAILLNTTRSGVLEFLDGESLLEERQRLDVRVQDVFGSPVNEASVTVTDNASATTMFSTGLDGWVERLELPKARHNIFETVVLAPHTITAEKDTPADTAEVPLATDTTVTLTLPKDITPPDAVAPETLRVDDGVETVLDGRGSTDNDPSLADTGNFTWNFADGERAVTRFGRTVRYAWTTPGTYDVRFTVIDVAGNIAETFVAVTVFDASPPEIGITTFARAEVGQTVSLNATATDNDPDFPVGATFTWTITGPEDATRTGASTEHTYGKAGTYVVRLEVMDAAGNANATEREVTVVALPVAGGGEVTAIVLALSTAALLIGGWFGGTDRGNAALWSLFLLPLYTRLKDDKVLDQFTRGQIFGYVRVHPGDSFSDIKRNLQLENGVLAYHLSVLEKEGLIRARTKGTKKLFYPIEATPVEDGGLHDLQQRILDSLKATPGLTVRELADGLGVSRQLAVYHLRALTSRGLAKVEREGLKMRCFADGGPPPGGLGPGLDART